MRLFLCLLLCPAAFAANSFNCPSNQNTGYFSDPDQCDKYWDCDRGVATARLCPDGMAFSQRARRSSNPCVLHWLADCQGSPLQAPSGTPPCLRQNGNFAHEAPENCINYYQCVDNAATMHTCNPGLIFNPESYGCDWPDATNRAGCLTKLSIRGFVCPDNYVPTRSDLREQHPRFNDPEDCRSFFVCLEGERPQEVKCNYGDVFSDDTKQCIPVEAETGPCKDYYKDDPDFQNKKGDGRADVNRNSRPRF